MDVSEGIAEEDGKSKCALLSPSIGVTVAVSVVVLVSVAGIGVSVVGTGVNVAIGGGVTCSKNRSPGYKIDKIIFPQLEINSVVVTP